MSEGLTFDDILLLPSYTDFKRKDVDLTTKLHEKIILKLPVISSPMDTVTEDKMAIEMAKNGGLGIIHRNLTVKDQASMVRVVKQQRLLVGAAVGTGEDFESRTETLVKEKVDVIVLDSGHGYTKFIMDAVKYIKNKFPQVVIMAGNVATYDGTKALAGCGADIIRVGMGPGSICTTRIVTGMGVPQITAIQKAIEAVKNTKATVIADGGIRQIGDMAKALAVGANAVMLGSMLAGYAESPGEIVIMDNKRYKQYRGMGSVAAMKKGGAERYGQSKKTDEKKLIAEGVESLVPEKGSVADFLFQVGGSLRSSLYYLGSRNLQEFTKNAKFIKISNAGLLESHPHSNGVVNAGSNYFEQ